MAAIQNRWTGDGLPNGTALSSSNVNTAGNGATVKLSMSGAATATTEGHGARIVAPTTSDIARFDAVLTAATKALVTQQIITLPTVTGAVPVMLAVRAGTTTVGSMAYASDGGLSLLASGSYIGASRPPTLPAGSRVLLDVVAALSAAPTTTNGRLFWRVRNLSNAAWNGGADFFYDSGYTLDLGVADLTEVRFGGTTGVYASPGLLIEGIGWQTATVNPADTSREAASAYFADAPDFNAAPTVTLPGPVTATAGQQVQISATVADPDGDPITTSWTVVAAESSDTPTLTGASTATVSLTAPAAGNVVVLRCTVTDSGGKTASATTEVRVPLAGSAAITPLPIPVTIVSGAITRSGVAASDGAALGDADDTTYLETGPTTSTQVSRVRLRPAVSRSVLSIDVRFSAATDTQGVTPSTTATVKLLDAGTVRQSWTVTAGATAAPSTLTVTTPSAITDWGGLYLQFEGTP